MSARQTLTLPATGDAADLMAGSVFFIGNATVLIRYAGFTILTDPTFIHQHEQVAIGVGLIVIASQLDGTAQAAIWCTAIAIDVIGPFIFGTSDDEKFVVEQTGAHGDVKVVGVRFGDGNKGAGEASSDL